jgi:cell shape-determining protein MreC
LSDVVQGRFDPKKLPIAKWREELAAKTAERDSLYREYNSLKAETQKVEQIRRSVTDIMREESRERTSQKSMGAEL